MNSKPVHWSLALLLGLVSFAAWSQQSGSGAADAPPQGSTDLSTSNTHLTADGVPACPAEFKVTGSPAGVTRVGASVLPPKPTYTPDPTFSKEARKYIKAQHIKKFDETSVVSLIVDRAGMPKDLCVVKEAGHGLDRKALDAVAKYRFMPATRNGEAVAVYLRVEVRFQTY